MRRAWVGWMLGVVLMFPGAAWSSVWLEGGGCGELEWYVLLGVRTPDGTMSHKNTVLGWLYDARDGQDQYDLEQLPPFAAPYLMMVFPKPEFGGTQIYASDYRDTCMGETYWDEWVLEVITDDPQRELELHWDPVVWVDRPEVVSPPQGVWWDRLRARAQRLMWLQDMDTGQWVNAADAGGVYRFSMNGQTQRRFRWVFWGRWYAWGGLGSGSGGGQAFLSSGAGPGAMDLDEEVRRAEKALSSLPEVEVPAVGEGMVLPGETLMPMGGSR